jgi:beta-glucoside PTS system EIICBA component
MGKYEQPATDVLRGVGGESNVASVSHCATRLRFQLKDRDKDDKAAVESTRGVITVVEAPMIRVARLRDREQVG